MRINFVTPAIIMMAIAVGSSVHAESACDAAIKAAEKAINNAAGVPVGRLDKATDLLARAKDLRDKGVPIGCEKVAGAALRVAEG